MDDCIFCKIAKKEIKAPVIWEDEKHIAFLTIFPNTDGFTVVATKEHYPSYAFNLPDEVLSDLILATKKVGKLLDASFEDVGRTGMFFEGFGVNHVHAKLFPMHGTADMKSWKPLEDKSKKEFFKKYPGYLISREGERAPDDELNKLAERIMRVAEDMK